MVLVRVFLGGSLGAAKDAFLSAKSYFISECGDEVIKFEIIDTDSMKREPFKFSPRELIDWLLAGDIHLIIGHLHQGNDHLEWDISDLLDQYQRLRDHLGFPGGRNDPIFLQNKILYLRALDSDDYVETLCIGMPQIDPDNDVIIDADDLRKLQA